MVVDPGKVAPRLRAFADAISHTLELLRFYEWSIANLEFISSASDADVRRWSERWDIIRAVWLDPVGLNIVTRIIKSIDSTEPINGMGSAIPVADEAEALRWAAIINSDVTPPTPNSGPQLVVKDGARVESQVTTSADG